MSELPTTPLIIRYEDIIFGDRERTTYSGIEDLATSIEDQGLEQPIILSPLPDGKFLLEAGGRRYKALGILGVTELYHAHTCVPGKPGFVLKSKSSSEEDKLLTELIENLFREDMDWRDNMRLIVKAYRVSKRAADLEGRKLYYHTFGKMVGVGYADLQAAIAIHDEVIADPAAFEGCANITQAYKVLLKKSQNVLSAELASRITTPQSAPVRAVPQLELGGTALPVEVYEPIVTIPLTDRFKCGNSLDHLATVSGFYDHIICDPDFAVDIARLEANSSDFASGVAQDSIESSLADLARLMPLAFRAMRPTGYFIFFYDLDHHEKLQQLAASAGFAVQRWPLIWHKTDYRSNAAPTHNFCKNVEYAMVCRKPGTTLATVQMTSVISLPSGNTTKDFGHPFAKPVDLWLKLYAAVADKGQRVLDPFMGSGSAVVAATRFGLESHGVELQPDHFNSALLNLQKEYRRQLGDSVLFS